MVSLVGFYCLSHYSSCNSFNSSLSRIVTPLVEILGFLYFVDKLFFVISACGL